MIALNKENLPLTNVNRREIYRYLGYRGATPDPSVTDAVERAVAWLEENCTFRSVWTRLPIGERLDFGLGAIESRSLGRNLDGCRELFLFAGTIGIEADRKIRREEVGSEASGVIFDAAASAAVETGCNALNDRLGAIAAEEGRFLRPRFSPGYGDFPLEMQGKLLDLLSASKHIGLTLSPSLLMLPTKSVSALIGISDKPTGCREGCENCENFDCPYRG